MQNNWKNPKLVTPSPIKVCWTDEKVAQDVLVQIVENDRIQLSVAHYEHGKWYESSNGDRINGEVIAYRHIVHEQFCPKCLGRGIDPDQSPSKKERVKCNKCSGTGRLI